MYSYTCTVMMIITVIILYTGEKYDLSITLIDFALIIFSYIVVH